MGQGSSQSTDVTKAYDTEKKRAQPWGLAATGGHGEERLPLPGKGSGLGQQGSEAGQWEQRVWMGQLLSHQCLAQKGFWEEA